jgi:hypothetical protein
MIPVAGWFWAPSPSQSVVCLVLGRSKSAGAFFCGARPLSGLGHKKGAPFLGAPRIDRVAATYSPALTAVPSARRALTALFGMGRGARPRNGRQQCLCSSDGRSGSAAIGWAPWARPACCWPISTARLSASPRLHLPPINVVVYDGPGEASSRGGFRA